MWSRTWRLTLERRPEPSFPSLESLEGEHFKATLEPETSGKQLQLRVVTTIEPTDSAVYMVHYAMFAEIDERIGTIATIEGWPKSEWIPFRVFGTAGSSDSD